MNLIAQIKDDMLYAKAQAECIPFNKFASWIESTVNKEVMTQLFKSKQDKRGSNPKLNAAIRRKKILEEQKQEAEMQKKKAEESK